MFNLSIYNKPVLFSFYKGDELLANKEVKFGHRSIASFSTACKKFMATQLKELEKVDRIVMDKRAGKAMVFKVENNLPVFLKLADNDSKNN